MSRPSAQVRNPVLALPAVRKLQAMSPESRAAMRAVLREMSADARQRAEKCWRTHKAPMAAYWKAVAVYAGHLARALRDEAPSYTPAMRRRIDSAVRAAQAVADGF